MQTDNNFKWARIGHLLRYDWAIDRSRCLTTFYITVLIYVVYVAMAFYSNNGILSIMGPSEGMLGSMSLYFRLSMVGSYFSYVSVAGVVLVTVSLHRKFTNPQSATAYLSLPGSRFEKYVTMLLEYFIVWLAVWALYVVMFYLTELLCALTVESFGGFGGWEWNPFRLWGKAGEVFDAQIGYLDSKGILTTEEMTATDTAVMSVVDELRALYYIYRWLSPFVSLLSFIAYVVVNMLFKHNGQLKTIAIGVATYAVLAILAFITMTTTVALYANDVTHMARIFTSLIVVFKVAICLTPLLVAVLFWVFYRQVRFKQAK